MPPDREVGPVETLVVAAGGPARVLAVRAVGAGALTLLAGVARRAPAAK